MPAPAARIRSRSSSRTADRGVIRCRRPLAARIRLLGSAHPPRHERLPHRRPRRGLRKPVSAPPSDCGTPNYIPGTYRERRHNGDWVSYHEVDFGAGVTRMEVDVASAGIGGTIQIHLDSLNGPAAGTCTVPVTGDWFAWTTIACTGVQASGVHDGVVRAEVFPFRGRWRKPSGGERRRRSGRGGYTQPLLRGSWASVFGTSLATATGNGHRRISPEASCRSHSTARGCSSTELTPRCGTSVRCR
jgi:Carbohydrate binding module (family 6)